MKVRQEAFYQREGAVALVAGIKGLGDYIVYPSGRMALRWDRRTTKTVVEPVLPHGARGAQEAKHRSSPSGAPGAKPRRFPPGGPGTDLFVMAGTDDVIYGTYTDFLQILYTRWTAADSTEWYPDPDKREGMGCSRSGRKRTARRYPRSSGGIR